MNQYKITHLTRRGLKLIYFSCNKVWHFSNKFILKISILSSLISCQLSPSSADKLDSTSLNKQISANNAMVVCQSARVATFTLSSAATGLIRANAQSKLSFRIGGTISQILVHNGSTVKTGQVLARLDDRDELLALRVALDQLAETRVQLRALIAEYGGSELDTASLKPNPRAFVLTKSGYYKAQTTLLQARQQLEYTTLRAPYAGMIANLTAKPYNFITSYEPFCTLLSRAGLIVEFSVLESELSVVKINQPVHIVPVSIPNRPYAGQVVEINPFVNAQGLVLVKARINSPDNQLFEGMNVHITIERRVPNQVVVSKSAVVERSGRKVVFTVDAGRAKWNYVTIAYENETEVAIREGLKLGDQVIISGNLNLGHDAPVRVENKQ